MEPMLWNHAYGRPAGPRDTTNALPIFNDGETLEEIWKKQGPKIAVRGEQVLAELRPEEELRTNRAAAS
jgi:hypothetical protein